MNYLKIFPIRLLFAVVIVVFVSCSKKVVDDFQDETLVDVNFQFSGFTSQKVPISSGDNNFNKLSSLLSQTNDEVFLYFWTFNNNDLNTQIRYDKQLSPSITYASGEAIPLSFVYSNYAFDDFAPGSALALIGDKEVLIKMPLKNVDKVSSLGFDIGSSDYGAKDFTILYSLDKGDSYETLSLINQFEDTNTAFAKHSYLFDLSNKSIKADEVWFKIRPLAGIRGTSPAFNPITGVIYLDNLYLKGFYSSGVAPEETTDRLHYFLFNKDKTKPVISGVKVLDGSNTLKLSIPKGEYDICFIAEDAGSNLLIPKDYNLQTFYVGNSFSNYKANIYGYEGTLNVNQDKNSQVLLERLYSQVKIEFTDLKDLDKITKITITTEHNPFIYTPFNSSLSVSLVDNSIIDFVDDFAAKKQIVFNQFLGKSKVANSVIYKLSVYGKDGLLHTTTLTNTLENNVQLVFRGDILEVLEHDNGFSITKSQEWKSPKSVDF